MVTTANQSVAYAANMGAIVFTPGSGTAYGAAITDDFESADRKLMGYFGEYLQAVMALGILFYTKIVNKLTILTSIELWMCMDCDMIWFYHWIYTEIHEKRDKRL